MWLHFLTLYVLCFGTSLAGLYEKFHYINQFVMPHASSGAANRSQYLETFLTQLWLADTNRLQVGRELKFRAPPKRPNWLLLQPQNANRFFSTVANEKLEGPTYSSFIRLLNNYKKDINQVEYTTKDNALESWDFLDAIMQTDVMKRTHTFLVKHNLAPRDVEEFKGMLHEIWFENQRHKANGNGGEQFSAFEHVFVGEQAGKSIKGYHNWVQLYRQETLGELTVTKLKSRACEKNPHFLAVSLKVPLSDVEKQKAYILLGTSPEFEIAAYTAVSLMNVPGKLNLGGCSIYLICTHKSIDQWKPSTCYPKEGFI